MKLLLEFEVRILEWMGEEIYCVLEVVLQMEFFVSICVNCMKWSGEVVGELVFWVFVGVYLL